MDDIYSWHDVEHTFEYLQVSICFQYIKILKILTSNFSGRNSIKLTVPFHPLPATDRYTCIFFVMHARILPYNE